MSDIDLTIAKGAAYRASFYWKDEVTNSPVNITGWSFKMEIRPFVDSPSVYYTLSTSPSEGYGVISTTPTLGGIHLHFPDEHTKDFSWPYGVYDLFGIPPDQPEGDASRVVKGRVNISKSVTKIH